jgi:two-component system, sensor histidine kinase YesM
MAKHKFFKISTLRGKLVVYFLIIIILMFSLNAFLIYNFKAFYTSLYDMLDDSVDTQSISMEMDKIYDQVANYSHSGSREYIIDYSNNMQELMYYVDELKKNSNESTYGKYRDIRNMLLTFDEKAQETMGKYDNGVSKIYINQSVQELYRIKGYIQDEIKSVLLNKLTGIQGYYSLFWEKIKTGENLIYILTVFITMLCLVFAFLFSRQISIPIHQLVLRLKKVAKGDLEVEKLSLSTNEEINVLIESFNYMISQIKLLIGRIKEKANVETQLKEQEIKNLEMANLLNQSELNFLQSQINPHFLFNTLNSITTLAEIEEASQTRMMIESMSNILQYNLRKLNERVSLKEELDIICNYLYIQRTRHGNRIEHKIDIDEQLLNYKIPSMIIQPFVENSIMHGLEPKEGKGLLELAIHDKGEIIEIEINDNGVGMSQEMLDKINNKNIAQDSKKGIGVINVVRRLEIYYGQNVIKFESEMGKGTSIRMLLPKAS